MCICWQITSCILGVAGLHLVKRQISIKGNVPRELKTTKWQLNGEKVLPKHHLSYCYPLTNTETLQAPLFLSWLMARYYNSRYRAQCTVCMCSFCSVEGLWLPLGPADGGSDAGRVFSDGVAVVRSSDRSVNLPRQQSKTGVGKRRSWRAAAFPGHQRAATNRPAHLPSYGLLSVYDWCFTGTSWTSHCKCMIY